MPSPITALALSALLLAAAPSAAEATTFKGKTSQGRSVTLVTGADGLPTQVSMRWTVPCRTQGVRAGGGTRWTPPFTQVTADVLVDGPKSYRVRLRGGSRGRVTQTLTAHRSGSRWTGTLAVREVISRNGKVIDVCQAKRIRFSVL